MAQILALQKLELQPIIAFPCFSMSWSDWSGTTA